MFEPKISASNRPLRAGRFVTSCKAEFAALMLAMAPLSAFAGNTTVLVVPQEGNVGVVEVQIPEDIAKGALAQLAKGKLPIIDTDNGRIQIKGVTRAKELLGTNLKDGPLVHPQPE